MLYYPNPYFLCGVVVSLLVLLRLYSTWRVSALDHIAGPPKASWLYGTSDSFLNAFDIHLSSVYLGHLPWIVRGETAVHEKEWHAKYGKVVRIQSPLGVSQLAIVRRSFVDQSHPFFSSKTCSSSLTRKLSSTSSTPVHTHSPNLPRGPQLRRCWSALES